MFFKPHIESMVMQDEGYDLGGSSGDEGGDGGLFSWFTKLKENTKNTAFLRSMGLTQEQIDQIKFLDDLGVLTPTLAQKLLFGDSAGGGSDMRSREFDDPRYWDLQYKELQQELLNSGWDAESARIQALATVRANRNNTALGIADTSAVVAAQQAKFAASPRDTYAEGIYRAATGGVPFGDIRNERFKDYQAALTDKQASIFQNVAGDLDSARRFRDEPVNVDFLGPEARAAQGLALTPAQVLAGNTAASTFDPTAVLQAARQGAGSDEAFMEGLKKLAALPKSYAGGGKIDFGGIFDGRDKPGFSPSSSEGGTNLNIHERAVILGESGQIYGTLGEKRPDGTVRAEQLQIKPLKSEVEKDKKLQEADKAIVETRKQTMASFAEGGQVNFGGTSQQKYDLFEMLLKQLGGAGGGTQDPFGGARNLAGLEDEIFADPYLRDVTEATYDRMGVRPEQLWADVAKYVTKSPSYNRPMVNYA